MPPGKVGEVVDPLVSAYQRSYERITEQLVGAAEGSARAGRLREVRESIGRELSYLDREVAPRAVQATHWAHDTGFAAGKIGAGGRVPSMSPTIDRGATEVLAKGLYTDLLQATSRVDQTSKTVLRRLGRDTSLQKMIEGRTAVQAGRSMARQAQDMGVYAVMYSNGSRHGLDEYAAMAMRTVTAEAYNVALVEGAVAEGCQFFEIFDGPDCGLENHDDPMVADGLVVSAETASSFPISHPNCRRSYGARPDVKNEKEAEGASRSTTAEQRADQIAADRARGLAVRERAEAAAARQQRTPKALQPHRTPKAAGAAPPPGAPTQRGETAQVRTTTPEKGKESGAVGSYKDPGRHSQLQRALRSGEPLSVNDQYTIDNLDSYLAKGSVTQNGSLYRGMVMEEPPKVGTVMTDRGYTSTSTSPKIADDFARIRSGEAVQGYTTQGVETFAGKPYVMDIQVKAGQVANAGDSFAEELILPRNTSFRVLAVEGNRVTMEALDG